MICPAPPRDTFALEEEFGWWASPEEAVNRGYRKIFSRKKVIFRLTVFRNYGIIEMKEKEGFKKFLLDKFRKTRSLMAEDLVLG